MVPMGGNITAELQTCTMKRNQIGERVPTWATVQTLRGWLDYQSGDSRRQTYDAKVQESTHVFVADFVPLADVVRADNSRLVVKGQPYDILLMDNPMELDYQWEIYLRKSGESHAQ